MINWCLLLNNPCIVFFVLIYQELEISLKVMNTPSLRLVTVIAKYSSATCLEYAQLELGISNS